MTGTIRLRARAPQGVATISIDSDATYGDLQREIAQKTGLAHFDIKYGFPPRPFHTAHISADTKLSHLPVRLNGEQLIVNPLHVQSRLADPVAGTTRAPETVKASPPRDLTTPPKHHASDLTTPPKHNASDLPDLPLGLARTPKGDIEGDPPEVPVPQMEGVMLLRVMPDDNSCMFRALSSAVLPGIDTMNELRSIVADKIQSEKDFFTKDVLEKEPDDYCRWIQREDAWGGGIELSILSQHFGIEICSINVQDCRVDRFNEGQATRCILVYSGIHYDVCAVAPFSGAEPEFDRKVFHVLRMDGEEIDGGALEAAVQLCKKLQSRHYYTDTRAFLLKCNQCAQQGHGEKWALQHAKSTGHGDFGEAD